MASQWIDVSRVTEHDAAPSRGFYLTDGTALFRVQGIVAGVLLELEDCMTLELLVCPVQRTAEMRLRVDDDAPGRSVLCARAS